MHVKFARPYQKCCVVNMCLSFVNEFSEMLDDIFYFMMSIEFNSGRIKSESYVSYKTFVINLFFKYDFVLIC